MIGRAFTEGVGWNPYWRSGPDPEQDDGADGQAPESNEDDIGDQDVDYVNRDPKD